MKKVVLILFVSMLSFSAFSQGIKLIDLNGNDIQGDTIIIDVSVDTTDEYQVFEKKKFIEVINNSASTMTIGLIRYEKQIVNGTYDYLCWGSQCFGERLAGTTPAWDVDDSSIVASMDTATGLLGGLVIYFRPNKNMGESLYEYEFYDRANQFTTAKIYVKYNATFSTGIKENKLTAKAVSIFPNPALDNITIKLDENFSIENKSIEVRDMVGKLVSRTSFSNGTNQLNLNVSSFESGIYFVRILSDGNSVATKKLIIK